MEGGLKSLPVDLVLPPPPPPKDCKQARLCGTKAALKASSPGPTLWPVAY